ncbi:MAG: Gfo/Idh/MocA family oxidoreductase [Phycisphaerae bacterium]|nr:Gfo/Idh/MocA family oxidoreductase [Phycisphaerae bacterium]
MSIGDGANYAPKGKAAPVVGPGEFVFAAVALDHGHINGQCNGLTEAGGTLKWVFDPDPAKVEAFREQFPQARAARSEAEVLEDPEVRLVAAAAIPAYRCPLGLRVMAHGKDYFTDKTPLVSLAQLAAAKAAVARTGRKYMVYYSERLHVECAVQAGVLVKSGAIGRVVQTIGMGPHRINADTRPDWFFKRDLYGGILCDIGSHQIEQFLYYTGAADAKVLHSKVGNYRYKQYPELEDFGDATLLADNGATGYFRVDWLNPKGLRSWGDGRSFLLGTHGYIELRKYVDVTRDDGPDQLILVNDDGEQRFSLHGQVGFPFFGQLILDCIGRTENAMTQAHAFKAAELCVQAQMQALRAE